MILTLTVECAVGAYLKEQCIRTIEIDEEARLYDLHEAIQDAVQFGRYYPFQFFLANSASPSARKQWLTEKEEWEDREDDFRRIIRRTSTRWDASDFTTSSTLATGGRLRYEGIERQRNQRRGSNTHEW